MTQLSDAASGFGRGEFGGSGFGRAWFLLTAALALHVLDEATTGFLHLYNPTVTAMRARWGWFPMPTFEFSPVAHRTEPSRLILLRPHARRHPRPTMAAASCLVLCPSRVLEWRGTHRVCASRTHAPSVTARARRRDFTRRHCYSGLCLADDAAPPHRIRIPACRPCIGTNAPPRTIPNAGPDVAPILCYDR
jgi:hypothetical protein